MILNSATPDSAVGCARYNGDVLISVIPGGKNLKNLLDFTDRIRKGVEPGPLGRPAEEELARSLPATTR